MPNQNCHSARLYPPGRTAKSNLLFLSLTALLSGIQPVSVCAAEPDIELHLPAQPLAAALEAYSHDTGIQLIYRPEAVAGFQSPALNGHFSRTEALKQLLKGTSLSVQPVDDHTLAIKSVEQGVNNTKQSIDAITLPKVNVVGNTIYDVKDPYNGDYVLPNATAGTKTNTPIMETPLNVQVISKQVLKDQQVTSLGQALKNVSGVTMGLDFSDNGNTKGLNQSIVLRGFASQTYFRNGFRLQQGAATREMANVESIEVLKGSGAILYGMVEPGGMVNVITKQPQATPYYAINQQFGSYDMYRTTADATGPVASNKDVLYRVNMSYENSGSFRDFVSAEKFYIAPTLKWNISPKTQVTTELEYNHDNMGLDNDNPIVPRLNNQFLHIPISRNYAGYIPAKQDHIFGSINWSHQFNDDWFIKHNVSANHLKTSSMGLNTFGPFFAENFIPGGQADQIALALFNNSSTNNTYSTNIDLTGHFDTLGLKHTLLLGGDYYRMDTAISVASSFPTFASISILNPVHCADINCGLTFDPNSPAAVPKYESNTDQYGAYLQDQIKLPFNLHVTGGLRYQNIHQSNWQRGTDQVVTPGLSSSADAVTPRVGLLWQAQPWLSLYSNYVENFGANSGNVYVNDTTIKPATPTGSQQWEVGSKTEFFNGRLRATFAYYNLTKQNVASADPNPNHCGGAGGCVLLTGEVRSRGPELDIQGEILPGWNVIATYANTDIIVTKGNELDYPATGSRYWGVPRNTASLWNTYDFQQDPLKGFKVGGGVTVRDGQLIYGADGPNPTIPGYATVDLLAAYSMKVGKSKISAQLNVNNLLDHEYFTQAQSYASSLNTSAGYNSGFVAYGAPRTFMGSIRVEF
jgi:iron complex outermembrane receptor protein